MPNSSDFSSATRRGFLATTGGVLAGAVATPRSLAATVPQPDESSTSARPRRKIPIGVFDPAFPDLRLDQLVEKYARYGPPDNAFKTFLNVPEMVDGVLIDAAVRNEDQAPDAGVARGRAQVLIARQVDAGRAGRALPHEIVGRRDDPRVAARARDRVTA